MRRLILFTMFFIAWPCYASPQTPLTVTVVAIVNFFCPNSYAANSRLSSIESMPGVQLDVVPISWGQSSNIPSIAYLSITHSGEHHDAMRTALFAAGHEGLTLSTSQDVCDVLQGQVTGLTQKRCMSAIQSSVGRQREALAWKLLSHLPHSFNQWQLPIFVIEKDGRILKVLSASDTTNMHQLVTMVKQHVHDITA